MALNSMGAAIRRVQGLLVAGVAGYGVASFSKEVVNTNLQWQQALYTMEAATGSAAKARQELEYVREVSERLGLGCSTPARPIPAWWRPRKKPQS